MSQATEGACKLRVCDRRRKPLKAKKLRPMTGGYCAVAEVEADFMEAIYVDHKEVCVAGSGIGAGIAVMA